MDDSNDLDAESPLMWHHEKIHQLSDRTSRVWYYLLLFSSLCLNVVLLEIALDTEILGRKGLHESRSYDGGFVTDLETVKPHIELVQTTFAAAIQVDQDGNFSMTKDTPAETYTGPPSQTVDRAWASLLAGLNIDLALDEASDLKDRTMQWPDDGRYLTGLDVFHSLHCLDRLRQALYPDYYEHVFGEPGDPSRDIHIGHCIDQIRQALQCHADLTPMEWTQVGQKIILRSDTTHTCRNFDKVHEWGRKRRISVEDKESVRNGSLFSVD